MQKNEFKVKITYGNDRRTLTARRGKSLKDLLVDAGITLSFPCGGMGRCGKCVITYVCGAPKPNSWDQRFFSEEELSAGKRLLCRSVVEGDCEILLDGSKADEENIVAQTLDKYHYAGENVSDTSVIREDLGVAIDLGTTTIAMALVGLSSGRVMATVSGINHQRQFGADVISRISAAEDKETAAKLKDTVTSDIVLLIKKLTSERMDMVKNICIAGNTTMLHFLLGRDITALGSYPYKTPYLGMEKVSLGELMKDNSDKLFTNKELNSNIEVTILPGISAFVGADIVAGIFDTELANSKALLMDLGTNGEMAFYDDQKLKVTSTAAGPVFEGGGIKCGVPSVPGAISHITLSSKPGGDGADNKYNIEYETINGEAPMGLCGTGVIEAVSELVRNGIVDRTGLLAEEFFEKGFKIAENVVITQQDIRNVQLAKAAIAAGMEKLLGGEEPDVIYIAGGFGSHLDMEKLRFLRMIPDEYLGKVRAVGNTSLKGAVKYLTDSVSADDRLAQIVSEAEDILLPLDEDFGDSYMELISF